MSQFALLAKRRFSPLFATQFFGVFNDSFLRYALVLVVLLRAASLRGLSTQGTMAVAAAAYVLPYFLVSAWAGQLADKLPKSRWIRHLKVFELAVVAVATIGLLFDDYTVLLAALFAMSIQSALFEPAKFGILPDLLSDREITGGTALVVSGTFLAIFLGTIAAIALTEAPLWTVGAAATFVATLGLFASLAIPATTAADPGLQMSLNPLGALRDTFRAVRTNRTVFLSVLGVSWFWFLGASFVTLLPSFGKEVIGGNEAIVILFLAVFCVGVGTGSLLCERLGGKKLELGLVPIGSIGLTLATVDLFFASESLHRIGGELIGLDAFLDSPGSTRMIVDFALLALFSGFFIVPLYALMQVRSEPEIRSRVLAGNSILNTAFIVLSWTMLAALPKLGVSIPQTFLILAALSTLVSAYIYAVIPEFLLRFIIWILAHVMYRVKVVGEENFPDEGPVVVAANHVTYVDWLILSSVYQRPLRFVMHEQFLKLPLVGWVFRDGKVIPIASAREDPDIVHRAFDRIAEELEDENAVCIFPEGELTHDGRLGPLKHGIERIVKRTPAPVVPIRLDGLWGSFFSRKGEKALKKPFRRVWSRITLTVYPPIPPEEFAVEQLEPLLGP